MRSAAKKELETNGLAGLGAYGDMIKKTLLMLNDHNRRNIAIKRGLKRVQKFNWDMIADQWVRLIADVNSRNSTMVYGTVI